jgi:hypothetical protein
MNMKTILSRAMPAAFAAMLSLPAQVVQDISQVADGGNWKSTVVVTNATTSAATVTLAFNKDTTGGETSPWTPTFLEGDNTTGLSLPAGSTIFLHTPGTAKTLTQGWAQLTAPSGVEAYVIYTLTSGSRASDSTVPAVTPTNRFLVPFDNTNGLVTAMAVVNPNASAETVSVNFRTSGGVTTGSLGSLPAMGQMAFVVTTQFPDLQNQDGLAEFYTTGTITLIALRANPTGGLTSAVVYPESGSPIIQGSGNTGNNNVIYGGFGLSESTQISSTGSTETEGVGGGFSSYTDAAWGTAVINVGPCSITQLNWSATETDPLLATALLDAGQIEISGPNVPTTPLTKTTTPLGPAYSLQFPNGTLQGGTYTLTGGGGTQVDSFTVSATMPTNFTVTNLSSITSINRTQPLTVNWTGTGFPDVNITASSEVISASGFELVSVSCIAPASPPTFSIPTAALAYLDPVGASSLLSSGSLSVSTIPIAVGNPSAVGSTLKQLTPGLVGGGTVNYGAFLPGVGYTKAVSIM